MKKSIFKTLLPLLAVALLSTPFCSAQKKNSHLFLEGGMGSMTNWQQISLFNSGVSNMRCPSVSYSLMYNLNDTLGCGVKYQSYSYDLTNYSENIVAQFVAFQTRMSRPMQFTENIFINLNLDVSIGCTFLANSFVFDQTKFKTDRRGFGMNLEFGFSVPVFKIFSAGMKCGYYMSFLNKPDMDASVPADLLRLQRPNDNIFLCYGRSCN